MKIEAAQFNRQQLYVLAKEDPVVFISSLIPDELVFQIPEFHANIFWRMTRTKAPKSVIAVPRGHAKTTLGRLACLWYIIYTDVSFVVYVSNTFELTRAALEYIKELLFTTNFQTLYGIAEIITDNISKGLLVFRLNGKRCIIRGLGARSQVRGSNYFGRRPQLAIVDDLESKEELKTEEAYHKLREWFNSSFYKALDPINNKIIQLGNMVQSRCLLNDHVQSPYWESMLMGCIKDNGTPLWSELWPIEKIAADYGEYQLQGLTDIWYAEMMNMPINNDTAIIRASEIKYTPRAIAGGNGNYLYNHITIDPAISDKKWSHAAVIAVHGFNADIGAWELLDYSKNHGMDPIALYKEAMLLAVKWRVKHIGVENVAYQKALKPMFEFIAGVNGAAGYTFFELPATNAKTERIAVWAADIKNGTYLLPEGDIEVTNQLLRYDPKSTNNVDDIIDACAHHNTMKRLYLAQIMSEQNSLISSHFIPVDHHIGL